MAPIDKAQVKGIIAARVAKELKDGDFVNLGIGLPTIVPNYLPDDVKVILQVEVGIVGAGPRPDPEHANPRYVVDAGGQPASCAKGGAFIDSSMSFGLIRGGHVDATVLGALQVDAAGNLANWIVPGKRVPGMGGAMDLVVGAKRVIVAMEHTQNGNPKILARCTLPLTAVGCVDLIVTEMGVIEVREEGLVLVEINPAVTVADVQAATEAPLVIADDLRLMVPDYLWHIAHRAQWEQAEASGEYPWSTRDRTVADVGFVHLSRPGQLAGVADRFYRDDPEELVVLIVDRAALTERGIRVVDEPGDPADPASERFPHAYATIPVDLVTEVRVASFDPDGVFRADARLEG
mgnify:CR=1 FL=1